MSKEFRALVITRAIIWVIVLSAPLLLPRIAAQADPLPFELGATDVVDVLANASGGIAQGARVLDKLDVTANFAPEDGPLAGWSGSIDLQLTDATDFSGTLVGDLQGVSNIDAPAGVRLANAFVAYDFGGAGGLKAGIIDLNSEFDVTGTAALFLNSSHGIGPDFAQTGENGPSIFPTAGLGLVGYWMPFGHWQVKAGVFEGVSGDPTHPGRMSVSLTGREGALVVFEVRNRIAPHFSLGAGAWTYTAAFPTLDGGSAHGNAGGYVVADGKLIAVDGSDEQGLDAWLRLGFANARINPITAYVGGGVVYTGIFGEGDQAGLAFASAHLGDHARDAAALAGTPLDEGETTLEATYNFVATDWLTIQPDVQYVISPGADPSLHDALVVGSRATLTWN